jgi:nicotinate phosphoribosyltransferase
MKQLPQRYEPYTDMYLLRALEILQKEKLNPYVRAQLFIRDGPGKLAGMNEAVEILKKYSKFKKHGGRIFSLQDGDAYDSEETIMLIEARIQDIVALETMILGVISAETTIRNDGNTIDLQRIEAQTREIVTLIGGRPVVYFGARHWRYDLDADIAKAVFAGGVSNASTDIGAGVVGKKGVGTIPHSLQSIFAWKYGYENAVLESVKAFDRHMDPLVPRVALVDFRNREVDDALLVARYFGEKLHAIRVDTCGENYMQGVQKVNSIEKRKYWNDSGVSIAGIALLRQALDGQGFKSITIMLTSGFGDIAKVKTFVKAEKELCVRLFDSLGVGNLFHARAVTMDIVGVGESAENIIGISKTGRKYKPNSRLKAI